MWHTLSVKAHRQPSKQARLLHTLILFSLHHYLSETEMRSNPLSPDGGNVLTKMWKYITNELFGYFLFAIECTAYLYESCSSKQLGGKKTHHSIVLFKSYLSSRMTFRNNSWYPNRVAQTSRLPLGQTEGLQIKHSHYLPIHHSHIRCASACFTCCRHTNIQTFCQSTNVSNLSAKKIILPSYSKLDMLSFPHTI